MTRQKNYLAAPDVLRVFCIFFIAWYHIWQLSWLNPGLTVGSVYVNLQQIIRNGYMLVDILLCLSGFLLFLPYGRFMAGRGPWPEAAEFYKKRALRILPAYWFAVFLILFAYDLPNGVYASSGAMWQDLITHLTFTHNLTRQTYYFTNLDGVLWTMAVEVQFYFIFPLLARAFVKRPLLTWMCMVLAALVCRARILLLQDTTFWVSQLPCMLDVYALGMLAAYLFTKLEDRPLHPAVRRLITLAAVFCLLGILWMLYKQPISDAAYVRCCQMIRRFPLAVFGAGFLLCGSLAPVRLSKILGNPATRFLSDISYNYYIWHQFLARRLVEWNFPAHLSDTPNFDYEQPWQTRYTWVCFLAAFVAAVLVTYLIEKPTYRWGAKKLFKKGKVSA